MSKIKNQYHYFYKITNNINGHFYYGVHNTNNLDDGYMGSGVRLRCAYKKYGIENFTKEILNFFNTAKEAFEYESEVVTEELTNREDCYNIQLGGTGFGKLGLVAVKDENGNKFDVSVDDPRYLSGELVGVSKGTVTVKDYYGNTFNVSINDPRYLSGELIYINKNKIVVKDKKGNNYSVDIDDERYLNGILKPIWCGRKHSDTSKEKMIKTHKINNHQKGEKNSQYGTCWIHNDKKSIKIKKEQLDEYISNGWIKGRKMKF